MTPWRPVPLPLRGLGEVDPSSEKGPEFASHELNVRSIDPRTGQRRISTRAGVRAIGGGPALGAAERITSLHRMGEHVELSEFVRLSNEEDPEATPRAIAERWARGGSSIYRALAIGREDSILQLRDDGVIEVANASGAEIGTIQPPTPAGTEVVRCLAVDIEGGVLVARNYFSRVNGGAGRLYRMRETSEGTWEVHWELIVLDRLVHFVSVAGEVMFAAHRPDDLDDNAGPPATVGRIAGITSGAPTLSWDRRAAFPVSEVAVSGAGGHFVASKANAGRATPLTTGSEIAWTPREPVPGQFDPETELWWWTSAVQMRAAGNTFNAIFPYMESYLQDPRPFPASVHTGDRRLNQVTLDSLPQFQFQGLNGAPGLSFDVNVGVAGVAKTLQSAAPTETREKTTTTEAAEYHRTPIMALLTPGGPATTPSPGHAWSLTTFASVGQPPGAGTDYRVVWWRGAWQLYYRYQGAGSWEVTVVAPTKSSTLPTGWTLIDATRMKFVRSVSFVGDYLPLIVSIRHNGEGVDGGQLRINGVVAWEGEWPSNASVVGQRFIVGKDPSDEFADPIDDMFLHEVIGAGGQSIGGIHNSPVAIDTIERFEAMCCLNYELDTQDILPAGHAYFDEVPSSILSGGQGVGQGLAEPRGLLAKFGLDGESLWFAAGERYGESVAIGEDGAVFTAGQPDQTIAGSYQRPTLARIQDEGASFRETGEDTWTVNVPPDAPWIGGTPRLELDGTGGLLVSKALGSPDPVYQLEHYSAEGELLAAFLPEGAGAVLEAYPIGQPVDRSLTGGIKGPESVIVRTLNGPRVRRIDLLGRRRTGAASSRRMSIFATTERGPLQRADVGTAGRWESAFPNGPRGLRPFSITVYPLTLFGDGEGSFLVYDARTRTVREFVSTTKGTIPERSTFGIGFRGRAVVGGGPNPNELFYSGQGDITDWDPSPVILSAEQAVTQSAGRARVFPDVLRGARAWNDDVFFAFGDQSVWRQMGDPMLGGQFHQVIEGIGIADGWAHASDPEGAIYFLATDGHLYRMAADGNRARISDEIRKTLLDIDLGRFRVELCWDIDSDGLWLVQIPRGAAVEGVRHLFWCRRTAAWHPVEFAGGPGRCVTAIGIQDGDHPRDRATLFAFADGVVRATSRFDTDDDGVPIPWQLLVGPIVGRQAMIDMKVGAAEVVLASDSNPCRVAGFGSPVADVLGEAMGARWVQPGRGLRVPIRTRGSSVWVGFSGDGRCAIEELAIQVARGGEKTRSDRLRRG